ncbi:MAG: ABC transporter permease [Lachnospiraceae bacterium]|nr:ABC transporter permease [Lachnospiraceae bacterium]
MKNYRILALRELSAQKLTAFLILTAVLLSTTMTAVVGQSVGVLSAMRIQQAAVIGGDRYVTFLQLTKEKVRMLENDSRLSYTGRFVSLGEEKLNDQLSLGVAEYQDGSIAARSAGFRLAEGRLPKAPMELALPENALGFLGFDGKIGDKISLSLSKALRHGIMTEDYDYNAEFTLVGITESNYLGYTGGNILGCAGWGTADMVLPPEYLYYNVDIRTADRDDFQEIIKDLCVRLEIHELDTLYNVPLLNALGISYDPENAESDGMADDSGFSWVALAGVLTAALVLTAAGLVIYNILKIAVTRRIRQYGTLRALGAEKGQLYEVVAAEILLLCAVGIPAGLLLGRLSAEGILVAALRGLSPEIFLAGDQKQLRELIAANNQGKWGYLLGSALVTLLFAFLAAAPAARFAARVSPVAAMSGAGVRFRRRSRSPKRIRNFERYYAGLNLRRSKGRTAVTVLSLVMSVTVFITLQSFLSLLDVSDSLTEHLGDYSVVNQYGGIPLPVLLSLSGYDGYFTVGNSGFVNGVQVLVSDRIYFGLAGTEAYAELRPLLNEDADREAFDRILEELCGRIPGTTVVSYEQTDRQFEESGAQIRLLAWGLILFIGLIGLLNIINTVYTNIHTRAAEIGTGRAIGMSAESLYKVFLWEGFYYGIIGAAAGSIAGYVGAVFVEAAAAGEFRLISIPVVPIAAATVFSTGACILATGIPLRRINRISIVDAMGSVE